MQSFLDGVGVLRDKTATAVRLAATKASTPGREQGNGNERTGDHERSGSDDADLARRLRSKNKKMKELYVARTKENDVLWEFIHGILPGAVFGNTGDNAAFVPDINNLRAAFEAAHGHASQASTASAPTNMVPGDLISESQKDLEMKYKALIEKFRETVGKYRLLQQKFDALRKTDTLRQQGNTGSGIGSGRENSSESQTVDGNNADKDNNSLVKKLESENKKLLSRGKDLYQKHKRLKLEHDTVVGKLSSAKKQVCELTEAAKNYGDEIKDARKQLESQTIIAESAAEHAKKRLEVQTSAAEAAVMALENLREEYSVKTSELGAALAQAQEKMIAAEMASAKTDDAESANRKDEVERLQAMLQDSEDKIKDSCSERDLLRQKMNTLVEQHAAELTQASHDAAQTHNDAREAARKALAAATDAAKAASARQKSSFEHALAESRAKAAAMEETCLKTDAMWEAKLEAAENIVMAASAKDAARSSDIERLRSSLLEAENIIQKKIAESEALQRKVDTLTKRHKSARAEAMQASKTALEAAKTKEEYEHRIRDMKMSHSQRVAKMEAHIEQHKEALAKGTIASLKKRVLEAEDLSSKLK